MITEVVAFFLVAGAGNQGKVLNVFAAASLKEAFTEISKQFEVIHPGVTVRLQFGGSQQLAAQILQGADVDLFASASDKSLGQVAYDPSTRRVFASNRLVVITPANEKSLMKFVDISDASYLVLAAPSVPAGAYSHHAIDMAARWYGRRWAQDISRHLVSEEQDVRAVLAKVELGEADAGIVYESDVISAHGKVRSIPIPAEYQPRIEYPMVRLRTSKLEQIADQFERFVLSPLCQRLLQEQGFRRFREKSGLRSS